MMIASKNCRLFIRVENFQNLQSSEIFDALNALRIEFEFFDAMGVLAEFTQFTFFRELFQIFSALCLSYLMPMFYYPNYFC